MDESGQLHSPCSFTPREAAPRIHCIGGWVGTGAGLDDVEKRKISCPYREWNLDSSAIQPAA
jgi:hypothetical protein